MNEIIIERYKSPKVDLYNDKDEFIGIINNYDELLMVTIKLLEKRLSGYYIKWNAEIIDILEFGSLSSFPIGLYDHIQHLFAKIHKINQSNKK